MRSESLCRAAGREPSVSAGFGAVALRIIPNDVGGDAHIRLKPEPYFVYIDWRHGPGRVSCDFGEQG